MVVALERLYASLKKVLCSVINLCPILQNSLKRLVIINKVVLLDQTYKVNN